MSIRPLQIVLAIVVSVLAVDSIACGWVVNFYYSLFIITGCGINHKWPPGYMTRANPAIFNWYGKHCLKTMNGVTHDYSDHQAQRELQWASWMIHRCHKLSLQLERTWEHWWDRPWIILKFSITPLIFLKISPIIEKIGSGSKGMRHARALWSNL